MEEGNYIPIHWVAMQGGELCTQPLDCFLRWGTTHQPPNPQNWRLRAPMGGPTVHKGIDLYGEPSYFTSPMPTYDSSKYFACSSLSYIAAQWFGVCSPSNNSSPMVLYVSTLHWIA